MCGEPWRSGLPPTTPLRRRSSKKRFVVIWSYRAELSLRGGFDDPPCLPGATRSVGAEAASEGETVLEEVEVHGEAGDHVGLHLDHETRELVGGDRLPGGGGEVVEVGDRPGGGDSGGSGGGGEVDAPGGWRGEAADGDEA